MGTVSSLELEEITRQLAGERFDAYAARGLARAYEEYVGRRRRTVGSLSVVVNGHPVPTLYSVIADPRLSMSTGELRLEGSAALADEGDFLTPFAKIVLHDDGSAELHPPDGGAPRRAIVRVLLREHYLVRSRADDVPGSPASKYRIPSFFGTVEQGLTLCRSASLIPFEIAFLLYLAEERARFEVDLVHSTLLGDPRAGRLAAARRVRRSSRLAWGLDQKIGRGYLSLLAARCLEVLAESNGLSSIDLTHIFGGVREMVDSALQALLQQRYASFDPRTGLYRARLETFLPQDESSAPLFPAGPIRPELRTSVQELITAADARATCPLCGRPLPEGPRSLLCEECSAQVGLS